MKIGRLEIGYWGPFHHNFRWKWAYEYRNYGNVRKLLCPPIWLFWWRK